MNSTVRNVQAYGLDLSLSVRYGNGNASAAVFFPGQAPQGPHLHAQRSCDDSAVQDLVGQVHQLMKAAYDQYRDARMCQWTMKLVNPVGFDFQLSVFDQWLLDKLIVSCPRFQLGWTPLDDHAGAFRLMRDGSTLRIQVMPVGRDGGCSTSVVAVTDIHGMVSAVRALIREVIMVSGSAEAAD